LSEQRLFNPPAFLRQLTKAGQNKNHYEFVSTEDPPLTDEKVSEIFIVWFDSIFFSSSLLDEMGDQRGTEKC
jgi:hypothetical protein